MSDIITTGNKGDLDLVEKQNALRLLQHLDLTVRELQIIDLYLSKIDNYLSDDMDEATKEKKIKDQRHVIFTGGELETALGYKWIKRASLVEALAKLCSPFDLHPSINPNSKRPIKLGALFDYHKTHAVLENGFWTVELECTDEAAEYVFIRQGIPYLKYLRYNSMANGHKVSKYGFFLYGYLENERYKHTTWEVSLDDLKEILGCDKKNSYDDYKEFNRSVLKVAKKDIEDRTDCRFTYKPGKKVNRKVVSLEITLEPKVPIKFIPSQAHQITIAEHQEEGTTIDTYDITEEIEAEKMIAYGDEQVAVIYNREYLDNEFEVSDVMDFMELLDELYPMPEKNVTVKDLDDNGREKFDQEHFQRCQKVIDRRIEALKIAYKDLEGRRHPKKVEELGEVTSPVQYMKSVMRKNKVEKKDSASAKRKKGAGMNVRKTGKEAGITLPEEQESKQLSFDDLSSDEPFHDEILDMFHKDNK